MKKFIATVAMIAVVAFTAPALAATNPFMDVPQGHWAYDAVGLLASRGIISGYPDGAYKGVQPATRYEMASLVARALVAVDADKASKQDLELLKKLVLEFKDELDALGVKVDQLDKRIAVLEDNLGGWKLSGEFYFDANFASGDQKNSGYTDGNYDNSFEKSRFRFTLEKQIDEKTYFHAQFRAGNWATGSVDNARGDVDGFNVRQVYVDTVLPGDIQMRVGRFFYDVEWDHGFYIDYDATFGDIRVDGFTFKKSWDTFTAMAVVGRNTEFKGESYYISDNITDDDTATSGAFMLYGLELEWQPTDAFYIGLWGTWITEDGNLDEYSVLFDEDGNKVFSNTDDLDVSTYSVYASYEFTPAIALDGIYYYQDLGDSWAAIYDGVDDPQAWKVILRLEQDLLKFTSLRLEYQEVDNAFIGPNDPYGFPFTSGCIATISNNRADYADPHGTSKYFFAFATQQWNDKWSSYLRYACVDFDTVGLDDATNWGLGITYQYTPAVAFRLAFDEVDYGDNNPDGAKSDKDRIIQFRTTVNF